MIREFIETWDLFRDAYLSGFGMAVLLALAGVVVVARNQLFLGAALAEASTLGVAVALWLGTLWSAQHEILQGDAVASAMAVAAALLAAVLVMRAGAAREGATAWVFLASASGSVLLVAHSPHGSEEIQHLLASSLIGATARDVWIFGALAASAAVAVALTRRKLLLFILDRPMAESVGMRVRLWEAVLGGVLGLSIGLSIRAAGLLYTFGCLVLPALAARSVCRTVAALFPVAAALALACAFSGFVLANHFDLPPGQTAVGVLCALAGLLWVVRRSP